MMNRRQVMMSAAASIAAAGCALNPHVAGADEKPKRVGLIGTGWYGKVDLLRLIQVSPVEVVSLCDVDKKMVSEAAEIVSGRQKSGKKPRTYGDYREMLKEKDLEVVLVGTPDHWHALPTIAAMEAGADVYCQKPTGVDVMESKAMLDAARKHGRVVQIGTQRRSTPHLIEARDKVVKAGLLGKVAYVELCCYYHMRAKENPPESKPPENLDYEMWTGPAPMRPFNGLQHPRRWRAFTEYSNGIVGDMCVHMLDTARWMLDLGWPTKIASTGGILIDKKSAANISDTQEATFDFGDVKMAWTHRTWGSSPDPKYPWAAFFYGDKGTLKASVNGYEFFPQGKDKPTLTGEPLFEYDKFPEDKTEKDLERHVASAVRWHMKDFLARVADRGRPVADIEQGHISSASCVLANNAMRLGRTLAWDPAKHECVGDAEANGLLKRAYRAPWRHPAEA
jgi:predicted dehydrogenase